MDTVQLQLQYAQADGSFAENVLFVQALGAGPFTAGQMAAFTEQIAAWWHDGDGAGNSYAAGCSNEVSLVQVYGRDLSSESGEVYAFNPTSDNVGLSTDAAIALGLSYAITLRTGHAGVAYRGRNFLVGIPTGAVPDESTNVVTTDFANKAAAAYTYLATNGADVFSVPDSALVIASRYHVVTPGGPPVPRDAGIMTPVTAAGYKDLFLDFQRRRAPAHNRHH